MPIWSAEIKEIHILFDSFKGQFPDLEKELKPLITSEDSNVVLLYSRRCLEVIVTELCEVELKRPRKTEPLKGIIDKLNSEEKVPFHIVTSMHSLNSLSTFGTHPKDFDQEQVKPVLNNLAIIVRWYLKYKETQSKGKVPPDTQKESDKISTLVIGKTQSKIKKILIYSITMLIVVAAVLVIVKFNVFDKKLEKSIAVLPFRNDSHDDSTQYFMDGVMEELLANLQKVKELRVLGRTSVEQYRDQSKPISQIAKELGVNYIVEGSGQKSGHSLRMRVQLIIAKEERHLWANSFEQEDLKLKEYFKTQSQFAVKIANELNAVITPEEKQLIERNPTTNISAYEAYLKGRYHWSKLTEKDLETAMQYFELAKEKDPEFALAYAGIGWVWCGRRQMGLVRPYEATPKADEAILKALKIDSNHFDVQYILAGQLTWGKFDWEGGESAFRKAIEMNPNHSEAHAYYSHLLNILGRHDEAMKHIETALKLDPLSSLIKALYAVDLMFVERYNDAIKACQESLDLDPTQSLAEGTIIQALYFAGKEDEAIKRQRIHIKIPENIKAWDEGSASGGFPGANKKVADLKVEQSKTIYVRPFGIAQQYALAGDIDNAMFWIEKAYEESDPNMPYLLLPRWDNLRNDQRFQEIAKKMKLPYK